MKVRIHSIAVLLGCTLCLNTLSLYAAIRYVKSVAAGMGDGSSWTNASADLQLMINSSGTNDEVWVAMGTYNPIRRADALGSITIGDRNNAFVLKADVKVYGGFAGNELSLSLRNYITNVTILSGDIGVLNDNTDNCYHVVISSGPVNAATLDGFTITKGYGITGGGITVNLNVVGNFVGGGIHNFFSSPTIANCSFISNKASGGGGMNNRFSSPSIINCIFSVNDASEGGGIYNQDSSSPQITNCSITLNTASLGGGISNRSASTPVMNRVLFSGNTASSGGAVLNLLGSNSVFNNCGLFGNRAVYGGAVYNASSSPVFANCTVAGNMTTAINSGCIYNFTSSPIFENSIVWGNIAGISASAIFNQDAPSTPSITYSIIEGGYTGTGNINADPLFLSPQPAASAPTTLGNYRLQVCSPAFEHGNNAGVTGPELDGNPRIQYGIVDMGAYEMQTINGYTITPTLGIVYVDKTKPGGNGSSWANAVKELGDALKAAKFNNTITQIWVAKGTYYPQYSADSLACTGVSFRDRSFVLVNNVQVYGGFVGNEGSLDQRNYILNVTTLSGDIGVANDSTDNCYHVVISSGAVNQALLDGFTISKGNANSLLGGSIIVNGNVVYNLFAGGIYITFSSPAITNCGITKNSAKIAVGPGGMLNTSSSSPVISNCYFQGNSGAFGGALLNVGSSPTIINCIFSGNIAFLGGGIQNNSSSPLLINCTLAANNASNVGGGIFNQGTSTPNLQNCIIWGNTAAGIPNAIMNNAPSTTTVTYCLIEGSYPGTGNINSNPLFISPQSAAFTPTNSGNYRLQACSPAIDKGDSSLLPLGTTVDLDSNDRLKFYNVDMGAYERQINTAIQTIPNAAGIVFVDSSKVNGSGNSWATAVKEFADVLKAAKYDSTIKEIWVAKGTYYPLFDAATLGCTSTNNRDKSFVLVNDVKVYGGFAGNEITLNERNYTTNITTLDGNIGTATSLDNAYHVVVSAGAVGNATLDGFNVINGRADGTGTLDINGLPVNRDCGAGMANFASSPMVQNCIFSANKGATNGGGMANVSPFSIPVITNCRFLLNDAAQGAGMSNLYSSPVINRCSFSGNTASGNGGGLYNDNSNASIANCLFSGNTAVSGAGINNGFSNPTITNCTITSNLATSNGGGINNFASNPAIKNSIIWGNKVNAVANAIYNASGTPTVNYSLIEGGYAGTGNINLDPLFVSPQPAGLNTAGDYRLQACSPAINQGDNAGTTNPDLDNNLRTAFLKVDMGAYEVQTSTVFSIVGNSGRVYVNKTSPGGDGSSWANAVTELAHVLKAAKYNTGITEIWVAQGTYFPLYDAATSGCTPTDNRDKTFVLVNNVKLYGGFTGGETALADRNYVNNITTLSGDLGTAGNSADNAYHVVISAGIVTTVNTGLDGFTITEGNASTTSNITVNGSAIRRNAGAGVYNISSSPTIANCLITANSVSTDGGGMFNNNAASPVISNSTFSINSATGDGGAMYNLNSSSPAITNTSFTLNTAGSDGGAIFSSSPAAIRHCYFKGNTAIANGGGMYNAVTSLSITNSLFSGNRANNGGALYNSGSSPSITDCTIASNRALGTGGGMYNQGGPSLTVRNSIIWGNNAVTAPAVHNQAGTPVMTYSLVEGGYTGTGNLNTIPLFVNPALASAAPSILGDYRLQACSPAINVGNNASIPAGITTDLDNNPRIAYTTVDMGAYEVQFYDPTINTWKGVTTAWTDLQNWCGGTIPTAATNVAIPTGLANYPVISSAAAVKNILLANNTSLTINNTYSLTINGTYTNSGSTIINNGSWIMAGNAASQSFPGAAATITAMNNLEINNTSGITFNKSFPVKGTITPTAGNINIDNVNLTLKSDVNGTANVAAIANGASFSYTGSGAFITERFIPTANSNVYPNHKKSWQFLAVPVTNIVLQTINSAWQEGNAAGMPGTIGLGTIITNNVAGTGGFDFVAGVGPSMKTFVPNAGTGTWVGISGTNIPHYNKKGYMLFVRGDRFITAYNVNATPTTLRSRGKIFQPTINPPPTTSIGANQFESVGNPYASAINFSSTTGVIRTGNVQNVFYVWDPRLGTGFGYGAYQVFIKNVADPDYTVSPGGGSYPAAGSVSNRIESGQAFFVRAGVGGGSIAFNESAKVTGSSLVTKTPVTNRESQIRTLLYSMDSSGNHTLIDGVLNQFHINYADDIDMLDALKMPNTSEALGILQGGELLSVERRGIIRLTDTIHYNLSQVRAQEYLFEIIPSHVARPGVKAYLVDKYYDTLIPVSLADTSRITFRIENIPGSYATNRFMLVFISRKLHLPNPTLDGLRYENAVLLNWEYQVQDEKGLFEVERSDDATNFREIHTQVIKHAGPYSWKDSYPLTGVSYYRIRYLNEKDRNVFSNKVKIVHEIRTASFITVFPNPVTGHVLNLQLFGISPGTYLFTIRNGAGQALFSQTLVHNGINGQASIRLPGFAKGIYKITLSGQGEVTSNIKNITENVLIN